MQLPRSAALTSSLIVLDECGSTNTELVARSDGLRDFAVLVTDNQTNGRGRLGREWVAPPGRALAISVLLRPRFSARRPLGIEHFGWLPLIAGIAMTRALAPVIPMHDVSLKWPNDVQVDGLKVSGLLAELLETGDSVVMGAGVNLDFAADELPTSTSTSLTLNGAAGSRDELADTVLSGYLAELRLLIDDFMRSQADADLSGILRLMTSLCSTVGKRVRVELPGGDTLHGTAVGVDGRGRLRVRRDPDGVLQAVAAGDVTHLRYE